VVVVQGSNPVEVVPVTGAEEDEAFAFLTALMQRTGVAPVDEDEFRRLTGAAPIRDRDWIWGAHLALSEGAVVAYAGTRLAPAAGAPSLARADLALDRDHPQAEAALRAVLDDARDHVQRHRSGAIGHASSGPSESAGGDDVQAWLRGATEEDLRAAASVGFALSRRLHVLALDLSGDGAGGWEMPVTPEGLTLRRFEPDLDDAAVAALLTEVYPHSSSDWDERSIAARRATDWFRAEDVLLLSDDETDVLVGVHWTRRRGGGIGEVHNLALSPEAQGRGLGGLLLDVGVAHLASIGCTEVLLWVDAANTRAVELYTSRGFAPRWDDVALNG
jgi:mycothiol synthase